MHMYVVLLKSHTLQIRTYIYVAIFLYTTLSYHYSSTYVCYMRTMCIATYTFIPVQTRELSYSFSYG